MLTGSTLLGLAMFVTLFLGTVLAVFVTLNAVRGDAERGLLQPLVVRPVGRSTLLLARFLAAATVCIVYVQIVYWAAVVLTNADRRLPARPTRSSGARRARGRVTIIVAIALLGTTLLSSTANGIAIFMVFGAGLAAGLSARSASALNSAHARADQLESPPGCCRSRRSYQDGLHALTADIDGVTGVIVQLGPFGGSQDAGPLLYPFALATSSSTGLAGRPGVPARRSVTTSRLLGVLLEHVGVGDDLQARVARRLEVERAARVAVDGDLGAVLGRQALELRGRRP